MSDQNKIMYDSDEAAKHVTVSGWVSRDGVFWPDKDNPKSAEHHARWGGCTHLTCECGNTHKKTWTICDDCRRKKADERYLAKPYKDWEGEPLCLRDDDTYFFSEDELEYWAEEHEIEDLSIIELVICEPQYATEINADDYFCDLLPEDMYVHDVAPKLAEAIEQVNKVIREEREIMSWVPGKFRTTYKREKADE